MTIKNDKGQPEDKDARKERQSADAKSTVKAPAKKDGHGGGFTWDGPNTATNIGEESEFVPHDAGAEAAKLNVVSAGNSNAAEADLFALRQADFPALSGSSGNAPASPARRANEKEWERNVALDKDLAN